MVSKTPQMTSAARTNKPVSGFTLIEIVMVLAIAGIVLGGAVGMMVLSSDKRVLSDASGEIELLAKRARTIAILNQVPYALEFREGRVKLLPWAEAGREEKKRSRNDLDEPKSESSSSESRLYAVSGDIKLSVRRWNSEKWYPAAKKDVHVWRFDPEGLCEPISVRLELDKSWSIDTYHPLTATISDSESEAR